MLLVRMAFAGWQEVHTRFSHSTAQAGERLVFQQSAVGSAEEHWVREEVQRGSQVAGRY